MTDNPKATRLTILLAVLNSADKFGSPMSFMEALICSKFGADYVETGDIATSEEWDAYDEDIDLDEAIDEETATQN